MKLPARLHRLRDQPAGGQTRGGNSGCMKTIVIEDEVARPVGPPHPPDPESAFGLAHQGGQLFACDAETRRSTTTVERENESD